MEKCAKCKKQIAGPEIFRAFTCGKCGKTFCGDCAGAGSGAVMQLSCPDCSK